MKKILLIILPVMLISGCASFKMPDISKLDKTAFIWAEQSSGISVASAYLGKKNIYIKYKAFLKDSNQEKIFYCKAKWKLKNISKNSYHNIVIPINFVSRDAFELEIQRKPKIRNFSQRYWKDFRRGLASKITPKEKNTGIVMSNNQNDLFLYYDKNDDLRSVYLRDKPEDYKIKKIFTLDELAKITMNELNSYLSDRGIFDENILMTTAFSSEDPTPFLYIDTKNRLLMTLKIVSPKGVYQGDVIDNGIKSADQFILKGNVLGLISRPFSSAFKLFYWGQTMVFDILRPKRMPVLSSDKIPPLYKGDGMDLNDWEDNLDKIVGNTRTNGDIKFLIDGDNFFPILIDSLIRAKKKIEIRMFIFDNDDYAIKIADILKKKSKQGIGVKVLLDGMGTVMGENAYPDTLPPGYIPPKSIVSYLTKKSNVKVRVRPDVWFKADHTKTIVIDDKICFTGGMNIGREYRYDWHDLMMEVEGPIINDINREFNIAWEHSGKLGDIGFIKGLLSNPEIKEKQSKTYPQIRTLYTRINDPQIFRAQLAVIKNAKKYIYIINAYFSNNAILDELINARKRGVDVRVILPVDGNHEIMNASNVVTANIMFKNGIKVYFYPGMSHIKAGIYDGWLCTGSANFDKLSFIDNLEFDIATSDKSIVNNVLDMVFYPDMKKSKEMTEHIKSNLADYLSEFLAEQL